MSTARVQLRAWAARPRRWWDQWRTRRSRRATLGMRGERVALWYLWRRGYTILASGERTPFGELDLIAVRGRTVVFIEVKTRRSDVVGAPAEAVTIWKQRRLVRGALAYLKQHQLLDACAVRFDVISIVWPRNARRPRIEHLENAFQCELGWHWN